jgi:ATP-dependent protease HslVU (ClpYQ) peptidase subunit
LTCIVGIKDKGNIYIGGDSAGVDATLSVRIRTDEKVFVNGKFIIGFTTSFRMGQLLRYKFRPPKQKPNQNDMKYMVTSFVDAIIDCFNANGFGSTASDYDHKGGNFLVGYKGTLYNIAEDFQVGISSDLYDAVGCGRDIAIGALYATQGKKPEDRINIALNAAARFSGGVEPPFIIVKK